MFSGQLPMADGKLLATGKVGADVSAEDAKPLAARCALNALAAIEALVGLDKIVRIVKVTGFVASAPTSTGAPAAARRRRPRLRACRPARPERCRRLGRPLITPGWPVKPGALRDEARHLTIRTILSSPTSASIAAGR